MAPFSVFVSLIGLSYCLLSHVPSRWAINAKGTFGYVKPAGDDHDLLIVVDHEGNIVVEEYRAGREAARAA